MHVHVLLAAAGDLFSLGSNAVAKTGGLFGGALFLVGGALAIKHWSQHRVTALVVTLVLMLVPAMLILTPSTAKSVLRSTLNTIAK